MDLTAGYVGLVGFAASMISMRAVVSVSSPVIDVLIRLAHDTVAFFRPLDEAASTVWRSDR